MEGQSEVAGLVAQINLEYQAARQGMSGLAEGVSRHEFLIARTERIAALHTKLRGLVSEEEMGAINKQLDPDDNGNAVM